MANNGAPYSRQVPRDRSLRASDQDRQAVGDVLRRAHVAGRLDADEYADRYGRCIEAKTYADLDQLVADLPAEEPAWAGEASWPGVGTQPPWYGAPWHDGPSHGPPWQEGAPQRQWPRRFWPFWPVAALVSWLALVVAVFAVSGGHLIWLGFPLLFFFVWRPLRRWRSYGPPPGCCGRRDRDGAWRL